jgi:hypothetical protein
MYIHIPVGDALADELTTGETPPASTIPYQCVYGSVRDKKIIYKHTHVKKPPQMTKNESVSRKGDLFVDVCVLYIYNT